MHIATLEDDAAQRDLVALWLTSGGHSVQPAETAAAFIAALGRQRCDLLLVDWMLPDGTGAEVIRWARENLGWTVPIIVLTSRDDEETVVAALSTGADDYVVKPAKPMELLARIAAVARRVKPQGLPVLRVGDYEVDVAHQRLRVAGHAVTLTQKEFDLAVYLFQHPGTLLSRDHLLNKVWGLNADVDTRTVDTHVSRLRKKLDLDGRRGWRLAPVYGCGYRFERHEAARARATGAARATQAS